MTWRQARSWPTELADVAARPHAATDASQPPAGQRGDADAARGARTVSKRILIRRAERAGDSGAGLLKALLASSVVRRTRVGSPGFVGAAEPPVWRERPPSWRNALLFTMFPPRRRHSFRLAWTHYGLRGAGGSSTLRLRGLPGCTPAVNPVTARAFGVEIFFSGPEVACCCANLVRLRLGCPAPALF